MLPLGRHSLRCKARLCTRPATSPESLSRLSHPSLLCRYIRPRAGILPASSLCWSSAPHCLQSTTSPSWAPLQSAAIGAGRSPAILGAPHLLKPSCSPCTLLRLPSPSFVTQFAEVAAMGWFLVLSLDLFFAVRNPFISHKVCIFQKEGRGEAGAQPLCFLSPEGESPDVRLISLCCPHTALSPPRLAARSTIFWAGCPRCWARPSSRPPISKGRRSIATAGSGRTRGRCPTWSSSPTLRRLPLRSSLLCLSSSLSRAPLAAGWRSRPRCAGGSCGSGAPSPLFLAGIGPRSSAFTSPTRVTWPSTAPAAPRWRRPLQLCARSTARFSWCAGYTAGATVSDMSGGSCGAGLEIRTTR